jgi:hypothetical protein
MARLAIPRGLCLDPVELPCALSIKGRLQGII